MLYLANSFSLGMLGSSRAHILVDEITEERVKKLLSEGFTSAIGHEATAALLSSRLGVQIPYSRQSIILSEEDTLIVAQLTGKRLESTRELSEEELKSYPIKFLLVRVSYI